MENISSLGQQFIEAAIKELTKRLTNNSDSHMQSTTTVPFSARRNKFSLLSNRNKINSTISDFHNVQGFCQSWKTWKTWKMIQHHGKPGKLMEYNFS